MKVPMKRDEVELSNDADHSFPGERVAGEFKAEGIPSGSRLTTIAGVRLLPVQQSFAVFRTDEYGNKENGNHRVNTAPVKKGM